MQPGNSDRPESSETENECHVIHSYVVINSAEGRGEGEWEGRGRGKKESGGPPNV